MPIRRIAAVLLGIGLASAPALADDDAASKRGADSGATAGDRASKLTMTAAVACREIEGYEQYEPLPDGALTSDEKLLVYYRPLAYQVEQSRGSYHGHLTQDGQIRRRGEKAVLLRKVKLLDYDFKGEGAPTPIYLRNTVGLKGLKPGEYEFDIILHDKLAGGPPAVQSLRFRIIPTVLPKAEADDDPPAEPAARPKGKAKRGPRSGAALRR